ncbi:hypothetical protein [Lyngbya confervoides]|uniref:Uncharacterized protein n=1 Tax=Lyngbya confervoides BDU141951 TaxID=1574623 RepID=A0ABD4T6S6_9CYAN|nr:hypothetical protein [Lyngbya confervoides]MCM1984414.1 hypothetical protein [Lyngbya confervoides BDU141951]
MDFHQDQIIRGYLHNLVQELELKLHYPRNDWRRREELLEQVADAKDRLAAFEARSARSQQVRQRWSPTVPEASEPTLFAPSDASNNVRAIPRKLSFHYR